MVRCFLPVAFKPTDGKPCFQLRIRTHLCPSMHHAEVTIMLKGITSLAACTLYLAAVAAAAPARSPTVRLDDATVVGFTEGT